MITTFDARFDAANFITEKTNITPQYIYKILLELPKDNLADIWEFIEFLRYKKQRVPLKTPSVKLGGLLSDLNVDITVR